MRRFALHGLFALALLTPLRAAIAGAPPVAAEPPEPKPLKESLTGVAKTEYEAALLLYDNKDYAGAALKFQLAYDASHDPRLLFNVADCEIYEHHYARAVRLLRRYIDEGGALVTPQRRAVARDLLEKIERFTTALRIVVDEAGAEIDLDDAKVGESPLAQPIIVDIGVHKVSARKPGFREATAQVPVGGAGESTVELKLEREVHEGQLTVHAPKDAQIFLDGKSVGVGAFTASVSSGGHTLRVSAPGMLSYQSEVLVQDGEKRTIDVALQPLPTAAPAPPKEADWRGALGGMEFGVRSGYGVIRRSDSPGLVPLWIEIGVRLGRPTYLGIYGQYAAIDASGSCGTDLHGPTALGPLDTGARNSFQSCRSLTSGLELLIHPIPSAAFDPWFGFDASFQALSVDARTYDPLGVVSGGSTTYPSLRAGVQLGLDIHPFAGYRRVAFGPFAAYALTVLGRPLDQIDDNGSNQLTPQSLQGGNQSGGNVAPYGTLLFGIRTAITF